MVSASWTRWSAIGASILALGIFAVWLFNGAGPTEILGNSRDTLLSIKFGKASAGSPMLVRAVLFLAGTTAAAAALFSIVLLTRGASLAVARHLGNAMGWTAIAVMYLFFVTATPPFISELPQSLPLLMLCDLCAFLVLAFARNAFVQFWLIYPRPIPVEEFRAFAVMDEQRDLSSSAKWIATLGSALTKGKFASFDEFSTRHAYQLLTGRGLLTLSVVLAILIVPFWRMYAVFPAPGDGGLGIQWPIGMFLLVVPIGMLSLTFVRLTIRFHRTLGTAQERRSVEWIRAGLMINFVAFTLMQPVGLFTFSAMLVAPQLVTDWQLMSVWGWGMFFALGTIPLVFIVALAASILYRGTIDPRLVVGRFTLWGVLGVLLTFIFVLIERAIAIKIAQSLELPTQSGAIAAGAAVAATFQPIRRFTEKWATAWTASLMPTAMLAGGTRHEGAVAVVDMTGYTALSAKDEQSALLASALVQREARRLAEAHEGSFVKSTGDGAILRFHTADEAMQAIREVHEAVTRGAVALSITDLKLHSGLNWGEFVEAHDGDIYGQTVNIAARIADRAKAGEIATSAAFAARLTLTGLPLKPIGAQQFKNVPEAIECHMLVTG